MASDSQTSDDRPKTPQGVLYSELPHLVNSRGQYLFCKYWEPQEQAPRALLMIVHGLGGHCQRYEDLATELNKEGVLVFAHDHVGHGQSQGHPADIKSFDEYVQDVLQHADKMRAAKPGIPLFVFGQSMGGSVAILSALERPTLFAGVIVSAPGVIPAPESATRFRVSAAKALAFFAPRAGVAKVEAHLLSRDTAKVNTLPLQVKAFKDDPLVFHGHVCARWAVEFLSAMERIQREVHNFRTPLLALHGDQDKMSLIDGTKFLYQHTRGADKQLKIYPGVYHEPLFELEPDAQTARRDIVTWVAERI
ncbi:monoglyceride lipase-like isoform X1 [Branchiostoma floridae x Branchiostoma japonicum]